MSAASQTRGRNPFPPNWPARIGVAVALLYIAYASTQLGITGERLARVVASRPPVQAERVVSLTEKLGPMLSECAPAYAVATLAAEGA